MKSSLLCFIFFSHIIIVAGQQKETVENQDQPMSIAIKDISKFKNAGFVTYADFGAIGDGKVDDINAIAATHAFANQHGLSVKADDNAHYYIGGKQKVVEIQTNTDFGTARFIIDDTKVDNHKAAIFEVSSGLQSFKLDQITSLKRNQKKIKVSLPQHCLIAVTNKNVKHYIRFGLNQNSGASQTDIFLVDKKGNVDMSCPIIWDFNEITDITALPMDSEKLTISGGRFTTLANQEVSEYNYYGRNIMIKRSNVNVSGLEHYIQGEGNQGAPYRGFISVTDCANVTISNTILTGHKTYRTIGSAGKPVSMGTYDISVNRALNVSFINCKQSNDINDRKYWGIMASNYSKNLVLNNCIFSRFDAHKGVANATIRNSTLGHMGINAIGTGNLIVENTVIRSRAMINLRSDYGSTWQGDLTIRNCTFLPSGDKRISTSIIRGSYSGQHDFGYTCYMPENIVIENLVINDTNQPGDYKGPAIFADFNTNMKDDTYREKFPYVKTKKIVLKNISTASGKALRISDNHFMFKNIQIKRD